MTDITDLISKIYTSEESLSEESSIELNQEIALAVGYIKSEVHYNQWISPNDQRKKACWEGWCSTVDPPNFSGSVDAALTIVQEGWRIQHLGRCNGGWICRIETNEPPTLSIGVGFSPEKPFSSLALQYARQP